MFKFKKINKSLVVEWLLISVRFALTGLFSFVVFFGVFQFGLRWEETIPVSQFSIFLRGAAPIHGTLTHNWVGDMVATDTLGVQTLFSNQTIVSIYSTAINEQGSPWRLILCIFVGLILSFVAAVGTMQLTNNLVRDLSSKFSLGSTVRRK